MADLEIRMEPLRRSILRRTPVQQEFLIMDVVFLAIGVGFFALMAVYARWAAKA